MVGKLDLLVYVIPGLGSFARFGVVVDNDPFTIPVRLSSSVGVGGPDNICPTVQPSRPGCNGHYAGVASYAVTLHYNNGLQLLSIAVSGEALDASFDAAHSVSLGPIVVDETTTWAYDDPNIGNPIGFTYAAGGVWGSGAFRCLVSDCGGRAGGVEGAFKADSETE